MIETIDIEVGIKFSVPRADLADGYTDEAVLAIIIEDITEFMNMKAAGLDKVVIEGAIV